MSAAALIAAKGQPVTLTYQTDGAYDPATGGVTETITTVDTYGVVLPMPRITRMGFMNEPGSLVQTGDQELILAATDTDGVAFAQPRSGDVVRAAGTDYTLTSVSPLMPAGTVLLYECFIRGVPA